MGLVWQVHPAVPLSAHEPLKPQRPTAQSHEKSKTNRRPVRRSAGPLAGRTRDCPNSGVRRRGVSRDRRAAGSEYSPAVSKHGPPADPGNAAAISIDGPTADAEHGPATHDHGS